MRFGDIPGLSEIKARLIKSVKDGKVAHAQLFVGREGALNLPLAIAYATYLHCTDRGATDACGQCPACSKNLKHIHPDTHFVYPVSNLKSDRKEDEDEFRSYLRKSWRTFLLEQPFGNLPDWTNSYGGEGKQAIISKEESREIIKALALKPFESNLKVMIIWGPEHMHPFAANGILKIVEEPPPNTFFLLISNNPERLLPTILSRTQEVLVPMLDDEALDLYLSGVPGLDPKKRNKIVVEAEGNIHIARQLIDSDVETHHEILIAWMRACFKRDYQQMLTMAEEFHEFDKLQQQGFLHYALTMMRETLLALAGAASIMRSRDGEKQFVQDFSKVMTVGKVENTNRLITDASFHLERNGNAKMIFLDLSLNVSKTMTGEIRS
jgi:DNA polymerase-3 subunit delta'